MRKRNAKLNIQKRSKNKFIFRKYKMKGKGKSIFKKSRGKNKKNGKNNRR